MGRKKKPCVKPKKAKEKRIEKLEPRKQRTKGNGGSTGYGTFVNVTLPPLMVAAGREGPKQKYESVAMEICEDCMDGRFNACGDDGGNVYVLAQKVHMFLMMRQRQRENGETTQLTSTQKGLVEHLAKALTHCSVSLVNKVYYHTQADTQTKCEYGPKEEDGPKPELPDMSTLLEPNSLKVDLESKMETEWEPLVKTEGIQEEVVKFEGIIKEEEFVVKEEVVTQEMDEMPPKQDYCPIDALLHMLA